MKLFLKNKTKANILKYVFICVCVCATYMYMCAGTSTLRSHTEGGQRTTFRSWFSAFRLIEEGSPLFVPLCCVLWAGQEILGSSRSLSPIWQECWGYRCAPPHPLCTGVPGTEFRTRGFCGKGLDVRPQVSFHAFPRQNLIPGT